MKEKMIFKPRARLLLQLGDELIRNESIALLELVKNSYDADATNLKVIMERVDEEDGVITIEDNGIGMDIDVIRNVWMEPGRTKSTLRRRTEKFGRPILGEKGIGRFAVHKLGNVIELITRKKNSKEVHIKIDWTIFEKAVYLDETPIDVEVREPQVFTGEKTGTKIIVTKFRQPWNRGMVRDVYRSWNSLRSPFESPESFNIDFHIDKKEWLEGIIGLDEIKENALFKFKCEIQGQEITKFVYDFVPFPTMTKLRKKRVTIEHPSVQKLKKLLGRNGKPLDLSKFEIGKITFEGFIFDRDPKTLSLGVQDKQGFKNYLDDNGGVKVYRDGMRVYDYGEKGNDWLNLDIRRVNVPAIRVSNNIIIAAVSINSESSTDLIEKTNREGFIENESYMAFSDAVLHAIYVVETQRVIDKNQLRAYYGATPKAEPVVSRINELRITVNKKVKDKQVKEEVSDYLDKIEKDYIYINETLLKSAGAGLSFSVVVHEADKIVDELLKILEKDQTSRISLLVKHLSKLLEGYSFLIKKGGKHRWSVLEIVNQAIFNMEFRLKAHKIEIIKENEKAAKNMIIRCSRNLIISTILNIIDNSIWWLEYAKIDKKKIFVTFSKERKGYFTIVIADNGNGFALPTEEITKPFVTAKPSGMGLGLHIAKEVMESHGGELIFPEFLDFSIPKEFKDGAIVALAFKMGGKK